MLNRLKNYLIKSLVLAFVLLTNNAIASGLEATIEVSDTENKSIHFSLYNEIRNMNLKIIDGEGVVLYNEAINSKSYSKSYNFDDLKNGNYKIELESDIEIRYIPFAINFNGLLFEKEKESFVTKPIVNVKDKLVTISKLALNNESLKVILYDELSNRLYEDILDGDVSLGVQLNLKHLEKGNYQVFMKSEGMAFYKTIVVK